MIKKKYTNWGEYDLKKNNYRRAILFYKKALAIDSVDIQLAQQIDELKSIK